MKAEPALTTSIVREIRRLQSDRAKHFAALQRIDEVLQRISVALTQQGLSDGAPSSQPKRARGEAREAEKAEPSTGRRKYNKLAQTGEEFILDYVRQRKMATTLEINAAWRGQGRGGVANNALGRLVKQGRLSRESLGDRRGSRFRLAKRTPGHAA